MTDREIMQQAFDLLCDAVEPTATQIQADIGMCAQWDVDAIECIDTLRQALAQPEQSKYSDIVSDGGLDPRNKFDAQPEQEPKPAFTKFVISNEQYEIVPTTNALTQRIEYLEAEVKCEEKRFNDLWDSFAALVNKKPWIGLTDFDDPKVQAVYEILCNDEAPPKGEHWEGFMARRIVDALAQPEQEPDCGEAGHDEGRCGNFHCITKPAPPKPEQEPIECGYDETVGMCTNNPCCEQKPLPLAWATFDGEGNYEFRSYENNETYRDKYLNCKDEKYAKKYANWVIPLYTAPPPKREWVGLTDEEIEHTWGNTPMMLNARDGGARKVFARAIETKLKEKNGAI